MSVSPNVSIARSSSSRGNGAPPYSSRLSPGAPPASTSRVTIPGTMNVVVTPCSAIAAWAVSASKRSSRTWASPSRRNGNVPMMLVPCMTCWQVRNTSSSVSGGP